MLYGICGFGFGSRFAFDSDFEWWNHAVCPGICSLSQLYHLEAKKDNFRLNSMILSESSDLKRVPKLIDNKPINVDNYLV